MGSRPSPVCVACNVEMRPDTNGIAVVTHALRPPVPYEVYMGDKWRCPLCGVQIITGFAENAIARKETPERMAEVLEVHGRNGTRFDVFEMYRGEVWRPEEAPAGRDSAGA